MKAKLALLPALFVMIQLHASARTWTGDGGNNLWSNPNNWSPVGAPQDGDELRFEKLCAFPVCPSVTVVNDLSNLRVGELRFGGSSGEVMYVVNGNPLRLTDSIFVGQVFHETQTANVTLNCGLVLEEDARIDVSYGNDGENRLFLNGPIDLNGFDLTILLYRNLGNWRSRVDIAGTLSGTGNVSIAPQGTCTVEFNGTADNLFTGTLTLIGETGDELFRLNKTGGAVTHGRMVIGGVCRWNRPNQIGDEATVVVTDDEGFRAGKLYFQGNNETIQNLEMAESTQADEESNGLLDTGGGGTLTVLNHIRTMADGGTPILRGQLAVPSDLTLDINGTEFYGLDIQAAISGAGDLTKTGNATLLLSTNNTFTEWLFVDSGSVEPAHANALGSVNRGVSLRGGSLRLISRTISGESLYATGGGATLFSLGTSTWAGEIRLERDLRIYGENLTHAHVITGPGGLALFGGAITFTGSGQNTFTGATDIRCELLRLNKPSNSRAFSGPLIVGGSAAPLHEVRWMNHFQLPPAANITIHDNGLLSLNDFTDIVSNLTFNGGHANLASDSALTINGTVTSNPTNVTAVIDGATGLGALFLSGTRTCNIGDGSVAGPDLRIDARIASGGITKNGEGTLALGGNSSFAGLVSILSGIVRVDHDNALGSSASGTVVNSGGTLFLANAADLVREAVTLSGTGFGGTNGALMASGAVVLSNNVVLASPATIRVDSPGQLNIFGVISGTGPLTKIGGGSLAFLGPGNNTYSGDTLVNAGTLQLDKADFVQAVPGDLVIGMGGFFPTAGTVRHFSHDQIWANVTVNAGSLLDLNGHEEYLLTLTLNGGGDVQTGAGLLTLDGDANSLTVNPGLQSGTSTISGRLGLRTGNHYINVGSFVLPLVTGPELDIPGQVVVYNGLANLHKNGPGEMRLSGSNTFTGVLYVDGGRVTAANNSALGATQGSTVVQTNGTLALDGGVTLSEFLILDTAAPVALSSVSGTNTVSTNINLLRPGTGIEVLTNGILQALGRVGSRGGITKLGPGTLRFSGATSNDYAGLTVVRHGVVEANRGSILGASFRAIPGDFVVGDETTTNATAVLRLLQSGQLARDAGATLHRGGLLDLVPGSRQATSATLRQVLGAGRVNLGSGTLLTISNDVSFDFDGSLSGTGSLAKRGIASMVMLGESPAFTGPTTIFDGRYRVHGSLPNSPVSVQGGSLRGDGRVGAVTVFQDGAIAPDSRFPAGLAGDLETSSLTNLGGGLVDLEFYGPSAQGGNDRIVVNGPVNLDGGLSAGIRYAPREGDVILLIRKTAAGPISGAFNGWTQGATRLVNEIPVRINYAGGDGNDLTLTVTNLALDSAGYRLESGNGNQEVEPDECNLIYAYLHNRRDVPVTVTRAMLRSRTPGAVVTKAQSVYPTIPAGGIQINATPFQLRTTAALTCGVAVELELQVSVPGEGTFAIPFLLAGGTNCNAGGGGCESCTVVAGQFTASSPLTVRVPDPFGAPSECLPRKPCPGAMVFNQGVRYGTHAFTNTTGADVCITAQLHFDCLTAPVGALIVAAYLDQFIPHETCPNYLGDAGVLLPDESPPFSFTVTNGARFEIAVIQRIDVPGCSNYWIEVFGLPCPRPALQIANDAAPGNVRLHWSTAYPDWRLQSVGSLNGAPPLPFQDVFNSLQVAGGHYSVTNRATNGQSSFRLAK